MKLATGLEHLELTLNEVRAKIRATEAEARRVFNGQKTLHEGIELDPSSKEDWIKFAQGLRFSFDIGKQEEANQYIAARLDDYVRKSFESGPWWHTKDDTRRALEAIPNELTDSVAQYLKGFSLLVLAKVCPPDKMAKLTGKELAHISELGIFYSSPDDMHYIPTLKIKEHINQSIKQLDKVTLEHLIKGFISEIKEQRKIYRSALTERDPIMDSNHSNSLLYILWKAYQNKASDKDPAKQNLALQFISLGYEADFINQKLFNRIPYQVLVQAEEQNLLDGNAAFYQMLSTRVTTAKQELPLLKKVTLKLFNQGSSDIDTSLILDSNFDLQKLLKEARNLLDNQGVNQATSDSYMIGGYDALWNDHVPRFGILLEVLAKKINLSEASSEVSLFQKLLEDTANSDGGQHLLEADYFTPELASLLKQFQAASSSNT